MNARKYTWQILHAEIRRRGTDDDSGGKLHPELEIQARLFKRACEEGVDLFYVISELAGFGATYALMRGSGNDPLAVAEHIELGVMAESDESDESADDIQWFKKWAEQHPLLDDDDEDGDGDD